MSTDTLPRPPAAVPQALRMALVLGGCGIIATLALAQEGPDGVVYSVHRDLSDPADPVVTVSGPLVVTTSAGDEYVDERTLADSDGNAYVLSATLGQSFEGDPFTSTVELRASTQYPLSNEELEEAYLRTHPGGDVADLWALRANNDQLPVLPTYVAPALNDWRSTAASTEETPAMIVLRTRPPLSLPRASTGVADIDPALALQIEHDRIVAIEARKTLIEDLQADVQAEVEASGGELLYRRWVVNGFAANLTPAAFDALVAHPDLLRLEVLHDAEADTNNAGSEIHHATQVTQFLDAGHNGATGSGVNPGVSDMHVVIIDEYFDEDHPVWTSRLYEWYFWNSGTSTFDLGGGGDDSATSLPGTGNHGSLVATALLGNGFEDTGASDQEDKSGQATGASLTFIQKFEPGTGISAGSQRPIEHALTLSSDVVNMSLSITDLACDNDDSSNDDIDALYHDGVFVVNTPGNNDNSLGGCEINSPGAAAGSFTPGMYDVDGTQGQLNAAGIELFSTRGGDAHGRAVIDMLGPEGREGSHTADWNNTYWDADSQYGTSFAAPVIAGSAADLKDSLITPVGTTVLNGPGNLFAFMLLMGDGYLNGGGTASETAPEADELSGMGRLRMRLFNGDGMDAPWKAGLEVYQLNSGNTEITPMNKVAGTNTAIPAGVDYLKAVVWWFEPNLATGETPADLAVEICDDSIPQNCYDSNTTAPGVRRLFAPSPAGKKWAVRVVGTSIAASTDAADPLTGQTKVRVHVAWYFEDRLRDDANGPDCGADIDLDCTACCAAVGAVCDTGECL